MRPPLVAMLTLLMAITGGCTRVGTDWVEPAPPGPTPADGEDTAPAFQVFGGRAWLGGDDYGLVLEVRRDGPRDVRAILEIPDLGVEARGEGRASLTELFLDLAYGDACPGTVVLVAKLWDGGVRGEGRVQARDCTGSESGTVSLLRRPYAAMGPGT